LVENGWKIELVYENFANVNDFIGSVPYLHG